MGRSALYRDHVLYAPARAEVSLEHDAVVLEMPDGRLRRHALDGCVPWAADGFVAARNDGDGGSWSRTSGPPVARYERRFVQMLVLEHRHVRHVLITPPDHGAVAPNVVRVPEAPSEAAIIDTQAWIAVADWVLGGGRLAAFSIADLARLAAIASPQFAAVLGEVAAQRALELVWARSGPLRGGFDIDVMLQPLIDAAKQSPRAADALVSALSHIAGSSRRHRRG